MTEYMIVRGAGESWKVEETLPYHMLKPNLKPGDTVRNLNYSASIGPVVQKPSLWGNGLEQSVDQGVRALRNYVLRTENIPVLIGYSLGSYVISRYLEQRYLRNNIDEKIRKAILVANPRASERLGRCGIAGPHRYFGIVDYHEVLNYDDLICGTPAHNVMLLAAPLASLALGGLPKDYDSQLRRLDLARMLSGKEIELVEGYISGREHVEAYKRPIFMNDFAKALPH